MWHSFIFRVKLGIQSDSDVQRFAVTAGSHCEYHGFIAAMLRARARRGTAFNLAEFWWVINGFTHEINIFYCHIVGQKFACATALNTSFSPASDEL